MPIYEYVCQDCGHALEAIQKFSDVALSECPKCGKPSLKKMISAGGFQLKGSGWYATDFKGGSKKGGSSGGGSDSGSGSGSGSGSDTGSSASGTKAGGCGVGGCGGGCA